MSMLKISLEVVVIAGASGIGKAIAKTFSEEGCNIRICDIDNTHLDKCSQEYPDWKLSRVDVSNVNEVETFFASISQELPCIDVLVNCAGVAGPTASLEDVEPGDWTKTIDINLNGMFYCLKYAIPLLKKSANGSIINLASNASLFGFPMRSPYTAAKWAVIGITKTLAMELGQHNIRVNAICPGSVEGERIEKVIQEAAKQEKRTVEDIKSTYAKHVSMKVFVEASDVANLSLFLASEYGRYISGQAIGLDGHTEGLSSNI